VVVERFGDDLGVFGRDLVEEGGVEGSLYVVASDGFRTPKAFRSLAVCGRSH
jgi:hypothetical protein